MTLAELLKSRRKELSLTLDDIGRAVGVNRATVQRWETGNIAKMNRRHIAALSNVLSLDPTVFLHGNEVLLPDERALLEAFRSADPGTQSSVRKLLDIPEPKTPVEKSAI